MAKRREMTMARRVRAHAVIRLEVVDLFPKQQRPHIFTHKLDHIQRVGEAWAIP